MKAFSTSFFMKKVQFQCFRGLKVVVYAYRDIIGGTIMATKIDKLAQELKKNYSSVQSKEIEHDEFKIRSGKDLKASTKSHQSELVKTMKEIDIILKSASVKSLVFISIKF